MKKLIEIKKEELIEDIHCRLSKKEKEILQYMAKREGVDLSLVIRTAIQYFYEEYVEQNKKKKNENLSPKRRHTVVKVSYEKKFKNSKICSL